MRLDRAKLRALRAWDAGRLAIRTVRSPGLEIHRGASTNFAAARFVLGPGARVVIGDGVAVDRAQGGLLIAAERGALVDIGEGSWLRCAVEPLRIVAFADAELRVGPGSLLNGCYLSAKRSVVLGRGVFVGLGARIFDADQHDFDAERPERIAPVEVGDHSWIAADATVLRGVRIGAHCVVGTRSVVTRDVPDHRFVRGVPAVCGGRVGDRSRSR